MIGLRKPLVGGQFKMRQKLGIQESDDGNGNEKQVFECVLGFTERGTMLIEIPKYFDNLFFWPVQGALGVEDGAGE